MKKAIFRIVLLAVLVGGGWYGYKWYKNLPAKTDSLATTKVQRGDVVIRAFSRGELRAVRSVTLTAPNLNGTVQVTQLAPVGSLAKEKDLVIEYDDSERLAALDEANLAVQQAEEQMKGKMADLQITQSQDKVSLLNAQYDVKRAELNVQKKEVIDEITGKKYTLQLEQSKRALAQLETDMEMRKAQADSQIAVLQDQMQRSKLDVRREQGRIAQTKALAEITGLVSIRQNRAGNFNFGQAMPDIREGDTLQAGMPVADILDLSEVEVWAKVGELDRANLQEGQEALLQLDPVPDKQFHGKIKTLSGTATADVFSGDPAKKFDVVFSVDMRGLLAGLGMKPVDVDKVMATAASNASKNVKNTASSLFGALQNVPGAPGADQGGAPEEQDPAGGGGRGRRSGGGGGGREGGFPGGMGRSGGDPAGAGQAGEGRQGRQRGAGGDGAGRAAGGDMAAGGGSRGAGGFGGRGGDAAGGFGGRGGDAAGGAGGRGGDAAGGAGGRGGDGAGGAGGRGGDGAGGFGGGRGGGGRGGAGGGRSSADLMAMLGTSNSKFSEEERNKAKLPLPPEQDSNVSVLLRPGLLSDVEIIVEKIPNVLHVPQQAVFKKNGKPLVYVLGKDGRFTERAVQVTKQSESIVVLAGGVEPGDVVALADPTADKTKTDEKKGSSDPMSSMPGAK